MNTAKALEKTMNKFESKFDGDHDLFDLLSQKEKRMDVLIETLRSRLSEDEEESPEAQLIGLIQENWEDLATCLHAVEDENENIKHVALNGALPVNI